MRRKTQEVTCAHRGEIKTDFKRRTDELSESRRHVTLQTDTDQTHAEK